MIDWRRERSRPAVPRSLATAEPGERIRIRQIHFDTVRDRCTELGIREGDDLRCLRHASGQVVVEFPECHTAALELRHARFVELEGGSPVGLFEPAGGHAADAVGRPGAG